MTTDQPELLLARLHHVDDEISAYRALGTEIRIDDLEAEQLEIRRELGMDASVQHCGTPKAELARGPEVADLVVELLRFIGRPMYFEDIHAALRGRVSAGGRTPAKSLLARYFDDPRLVRTRRGVYALAEWQTAQAA